MNSMSEIGLSNIGLKPRTVKPEGLNFGKNPMSVFSQTSQTLDDKSIRPYTPQVRLQVRFAGDAAIAEPDTLTDFQASLPFPLDEFQKDAIKALTRGESVVVAVPTSAGKTVVADFAMFDVIQATKTGSRLFYTTPRKALTNEKYEDFVKKYGADNVGLMTGDATINPNAPIILMTTEVYRNMMYDPSGSRNGKRLEKLAYVVFDECHFINDEHRGLVWEESMMYSPPGVQQIHLSATIRNAKQYTDWLNRLQKGTFTWVPGPGKTVKRPVPLTYHFLNLAKRDSSGHDKPADPSDLDPARGIIPMLDDQGAKTKPFKHAFKIAQQKNYFDPVSAVSMLNRKQMLPAILFCFSRRKTEEMAEKVVEQNIELLNPTEQTRIASILGQFTQIYPWLEERPIYDYVQSGIGMHHGGMLPAEKKLVEVLMKKGLLKAVFATDTLAAGMNVPAKTVVVTGYRRKMDGDTVDLSQSDFQQMTGRAGRRGMDVKGNVVLTSPPEEIGQDGMMSYVKSEANPVDSHFEVRTGMALNLLASRSVPEIKYLLDRSFRQYQLVGGHVDGWTEGKANTSVLSTQFDELRKLLRTEGFLTQQNQLTPLGKIAAAIHTPNHIFIAKGIQSGLFKALTPAQFAAVIASTVSGKDMDGLMAATSSDPQVQSVIESLQTAIDASFLPKFDPLNARPSNGIQEWVSDDGDWNKILAEEFPGDTLDVIRRTANVLRSIEEDETVRKNYYGIASLAKQAADRLLRSPVQEQIMPLVLKEDGGK
ncbi:MAG: DEAD/DEAH box helicase [Cyanobacteria bacterium]|nr:DEAD/DEAH box helicase [Cyanobacteriota bacterium]